jgi:hypothetical protein
VRRTQPVNVAPSLRRVGLTAVGRVVRSGLAPVWWAQGLCCQLKGAGESDGSRWGACHPGAPGTALAAWEVGPGAGANPELLVLSHHQQWPVVCRLFLGGRLAQACALQGCGVGTPTWHSALRHSSAALLCLSALARSLQHCPYPSYALRIWSKFGPPRTDLVPKCMPRPFLRGRALESGGLFCMEAGIEPAAWNFCQQRSHFSYALFIPVGFTDRPRHVKGVSCA